MKGLGLLRNQLKWLAKLK